MHDTYYASKGTFKNCYFNSYKNTCYIELNENSGFDWKMYGIWRSGHEVFFIHFLTKLQTFVLISRKSIVTTYNYSVLE